MSNARRDENSVPTLIAVSSTDGLTPTLVYADPSTHRLLVNNTGGGGGGGITWNVITTDTSGAINNGYVANSASLVTVTLPSTAAAGSIVEVTFSSTGGWKLAQNSGQTVHFGIKNTMTGTGGSLASNSAGDSVRVVCVIANTDWNVLSVQGNLTVV